MEELLSQSTTKEYNFREEEPQSLLSLVDKYVKIQLIKNVSFIGFIHSIDPVSYSIILSTPLENTYQTILIPGHAVLKVSEETMSTNVKPPVRKQCDLTEQYILDRKAKLIAWLKFNLLPVSESGDRIMLKNASVLPPYSFTDIYAENSVITLQIRQIMERMPDDFQPM